MKGSYFLIPVLVCVLLAVPTTSSADISLGIWLSDTSDYPAFEDTVVKKHAIVQYALLWDAAASSHTTQLSKIDGYGAVPMCIWGRGKGTTYGNMSYAQVVAGDADAAIRAVAQKVAAFGKTVIFTIDMEFNHQDNPSCYLNDPSRSASGFGTMWRHVVTVFDNAGATNVQWAWIPNYQGSPNTPENNYNNYYPGDGYVDWVGALGFDADWGGSGSAGLSFNMLFSSILSDLASRYSTKPQIIGWFGTAERDALKKANWLSQSYGAMASYANLRAVCYHNSTQGSFDYLIWGGSTPESVTNAYAQAIQPTYFLSVLPPYADIVPTGSGSGAIIDLIADKSTYNSTDSILVTANVQTSSTPFYPYVRILMADGRTLYYVKDSGFTSTSTPYISGGPFSPAAAIYGYQVLNVSFSGIATGQYTLEGLAADASMNPIGSVDSQVLTVQ